MDNKIQELVKLNKSLKVKEAELKKELKSAQEEIKKYLKETGQEKIEHEGIKVSYTMSEKCSINEELLIATIKKLARSEKDKDLKKAIRDSVIKVEAINEEHLENLLFNEVLTVEEIEHCYETKQVWTLRVK